MHLICTAHFHPPQVVYIDRPIQLHNGNNESDVQDLIDDDLWEGDLEAYPITKDLYSRTVDSNYQGIIDKVEYEEVSISYD